MAERGRGIYGKKSQFAIIVGEILRENGGARRVDVWADGRWLTCEDNNVNIPFLPGCLQAAVDDLLSDPSSRCRGRPYQELSVADNYRRLRAEYEIACETDDAIVAPHYMGYQFMHWGPTADNVGMLLFREGGTAYLPFSFLRPDHYEPSELGKVFVAALPERELAIVLHDAAWALIWDWADRSKWPRSAEQTAAPDGHE